MSRNGRCAQRDEPIDHVSVIASVIGSEGLHGGCALRRVTGNGLVMSGWHLPAFAYGAGQFRPD